MAEPVISSKENWADAGPDPRPPIVGVLGFFGAALGILGLLLIPYAALPMAMGSWLTPDSTPITDFRGGVTTAWVLASTLLGVLVSVWMLIAGIGCLGLRWWGRGLMIACSIVSLIYGALGLYFYPHIFFGLWGPALPLQDIGPLALLGGWILGTIYAAFALYYLTRPVIREAFHRAAEAEVKSE